MPLYDHFRPPLSTRRHWHAFHNSWATYLASSLNSRLPSDYFAEANVQFGIEIDVATFEEPESPGSVGPGFVAPAPTLTVPMTLMGDVVEVLVFHQEGGPSLAGAIELVSPANKDRAAHREAFVSKCAFYLQQGVGLIVVDAVTDRQGDLHGELLSRVSSAPDAAQTDLFAAAYRPIVRDGETSLDFWYHRLAVGRPLPELPLFLKGGVGCLVDFEATYQRTCAEQRFPGVA